MADICFILTLDPELMKALETLVLDTPFADRNEAIATILRTWLTATGYLDEDKPISFPPLPEDGSK